MSKLLRRALKSSITPAILMIAGKIFGIFGVSAIYGLTLNIGNDINGFFSTQIYFPNEASTLFVNSFSDLAMIIVLFVPTMYFIIKTALFQSTFSNPKTIVKVAKFNILSWITKDNTTFLSTFIWSAFVLVSCSVAIANSLRETSYIYIGIVAGVFIFTVLLGLIKIFEVEINKVYPDSKKYY